MLSVGVHSLTPPTAVTHIILGQNDKHKKIKVCDGQCFYVIIN